MWDLLWPEAAALVYVMGVLGGWCNLRSRKIKHLYVSWRLLYQLPTNVWIFVDRVLNVTIVALICWLLWRKHTVTVWETISSRIGRDFEGSLAHAVLDIFMLDWGTFDRPGHCERYRGE